MQTILLNWSCLLANAGTMRDVSDYFRHPIALRGGGAMLLTGICLVLFWAAMNYWEQHRIRLATSLQTPTALFNALCQVHDLTRDQIQLLQTCVQDPHELPLLFVDPSLLESIAKSRPAHTAGALKLRDILFGTHLAHHC